MAVINPNIWHNHSRWDTLVFLGWCDFNQSSLHTWLINILIGQQLTTWIAFSILNKRQLLIIDIILGSRHEVWYMYEYYQCIIKPLKTESENFNYLECDQHVIVFKSFTDLQEGLRVYSVWEYVQFCESTILTEGLSKFGTRLSVKPSDQTHIHIYIHTNAK